MIDHYPQIKAVHVHAIGLSFSIFFLRGLLMLARSRFTNLPGLRYLSYTVDTVLLVAAILLTVALGQYPFVHHWLTAKVLLLFAYIVLGTLALKRAKTRQAQVLAFIAACLTFAMLFAIARAHHWAGPFASLLR